MHGLPHAALLALSLVCYLFSIAEVHGQALEAKSVFTNLQTSGLPLFTYHGSVRAGKDAKVPILLHVLVKVKRRANGSVVVRTTSYPERVDVQGECPRSISNA